MSDGTTGYRLDQLEKNYGDLTVKVDDVRTKILPRLELKIVSLETRINVFTTVNVVAIIAGIIITKLLN